MSMGFFSIMEKMSKENKLKNEKIIRKSEKRILELIENEELDMKVGIAILALELSYPEALTIFFNL